MDPDPLRHERDLVTEELRFDEPRPVMVDELTIDGSGVWIVSTRASNYVVDLDLKTMTRIPGPTARSDVNDVTRQLRSLIACKVGARGHWNMEPNADEMFDDGYWQYTSAIRSIRRATLINGT